jgi:AmmeMemoRadiSam system protein A
MNTDMNTDDLCKELNQQEQKVALEIARNAIKKHIIGVPQETPIGQLLDQYPILKITRGVFVTLHIGGQLRGCIGTFEPDKCLAETIQEMAFSAAFRDPRFYPLTRDELEQVKIEISILSPMKKITDPNLIEVGKHGVFVKKGSRGGVYLPQVAHDAGWSREQFLDHLCEHKAGIGADAWRDGSAEIYIFTAQIFSEK